ncbi:MAG: hypothetical protein ACI9VS_001035 [Candidatus Binatia bacterium]|jgi:hypothetical protein
MRHHPFRCHQSCAIVSAVVEAIIKKPKDAIALFLLGVPLLMTGIMCQFVTLANGNYGSVLLIGLGLTILADVCFIKAFLHGGTKLRWLSGIALLPTLPALGDFINRAPYFLS